MKISFLSKMQCAFKLDGEYLGIINNNYKTVDIEGEHLFEFIPKNNDYLPIGYVYKECEDKTENISIMNLYKGFLCELTFNKKPPTNFEMINQDKIYCGNNYLLYTVFSESYIKFVLEFNNYMVVEKIPFKPIKIEHYEFYSKCNYIIFFFISTKTFVLAFDIDKGLKVVFKNIVDSYYYEKSNLCVTQLKNDICKHKIVSLWNFESQVKFISCEISKEVPIYKLSKNLFPYAFLEDIIVGNDITNYLSPLIRDKADKLKEFLGEFQSILPPPHYIDKDYILLKYANRISFVKITYENNLITDVSLIEE